MSCAPVAGYLIRNLYREHRKVAAPVVLILLPLFSAFTVYMAQKPGESQQWGWLVAALLILTTCFCIYSIGKSSWLLYIRYECTKDCVVNVSRKGTHELALRQPFFCTKIVVPFYYGKGICSDEFFYMLSSAPPCDPERTTGGLAAIKSIWKSNGLLIPCTDTVDQFLAEVTGAGEIPMYPKVQYFQR